MVASPAWLQVIVIGDVCVDGGHRCVVANATCGGGACDHAVTRDAEILLLRSRLLAIELKACLVLHCCVESTLRSHGSGPFPRLG